MAIEKSIEREEKIDLGVEDQSNEIKLKVEEEQEDIGEGVLQEDGSVVFGAITEVSTDDLEFGSNSKPKLTKNYCLPMAQSKPK